MENIVGVFPVIFSDKEGDDISPSKWFNLSNIKRKNR